VAAYDVVTPELGSISIRLPNVGSPNGPAGPSGLQFTTFLSYEYDGDFLTPSDQWSFTVSGDSLSDQDRASLIPGARVEVSIDGNPQSVGYLDDIRTIAGRGGTIITLEGRDWMSPAVDAQADQSYRLNSGATLLQLLNDQFAPFGMTVVSDDNIANVNAMTGAKRGHKTSKKGKTSKTALLHETKPYPQEGVFAFCSRVSQRFGLWLWPTTTYGTIVAGQPDFLQDPSYTILHSTDAATSLHNNVEDSDVVISRKDQPTILFASGFGAGGDFAKSRLRGGIINPLISNGEELYAPIVAKYSDVKFATVDFTFPPVGNFIPIPDPNARPLYLYDPESHTQDQLDAYLRRELSLRMRKALTASYTIMGHTLGGQPIAVDTIASVQDDRSALNMNLWILGRKFVKTARGGTLTHIKAILPGSLYF
jgi:prophage tail gpP-like protein